MNNKVTTSNPPHISLTVTKHAMANDLSQTPQVIKTQRFSLEDILYTRTRYTIV